jgi:exodeoxyribonuclease VII small subunit
LTDNSNDTKSNDASNDDTRFEDALHELEEIVKKIETGEHSLEENLEFFERGIALTRQCSSKLDAATQRIKKLVDENGIEEMETD